MNTALRQPAMRSALCLPASVPRFIERARGLPADLVILDLEDAVAPAIKETAREAAVAALRQDGWRTGARAVRINALDTRWARDDLTALAGCAHRLTEVVVPKVHSLDDLTEVGACLTAIERKVGIDPGTIGVQVQIEDSQGLTVVDQLATHPRVTTLAFGPVDFTANMGIRTKVGGLDTTSVQAEVFTYALLRVLVAARANGLTALDGPYPAIRDLTGLDATATRAAAMGFDGKWALHPDHVEGINRAFTPSTQEVDRAKAVLAAVAASTGAALLDGGMVDEATRKQAASVLARAEAGNAWLP